MPHPFLQLTIDEFEELAARFEFTREINAVHVHHTWRPRQREFKGLRTVEAMCRVHKEELGLGDIAQHITIDPDGFVWTGRAWNQPPASAVGHNGTRAAGPFMFELVGDFDEGQDQLKGEQRRSALCVIAALQRRFGSNKVPVRFHRHLNPGKSCPGKAVDFDQFLRELAELPSQPRAKTIEAGGDEGPIDASKRIGSTTIRDRVLHQAQLVLSAPGDARAADDGELHECADPAVRGFRESRAMAARGGLTPEQLRRLRPHVINLRNGDLTQSGVYWTLPQDVDDLVNVHLKRAYEAKDAEQPFRVVLYAHGGLVSEEVGLQQAANTIEWWTANGIYPIYFVWETGLFDTIGHLLRGTRAEAASRGFISDRITDPALETLARRLGGEKIWDGMKRNAWLCSQPRGGAHLFAKFFSKFCEGRQVETHAVGHSAGSIFLADFLPALINVGSRHIKSLHLLAPAIRTDEYCKKLYTHMGRGIDFTTMYTMSREFELDDHCAHIYRKSLLYLIHHALEPQPKTNLLGLEVSVKNDAALRLAFALDGSAPSIGEVLFARTGYISGDAASLATSHGDFDDDAATMNSVALRILGRKRTEELKQPFPASRGIDHWTEDLFASIAEDLPRAATASAPVVMYPSPEVLKNPAPASTATPISPGARAGHKRALCIGINDYARQPLSGCVSDARLWASTLQSLGFEVHTMFDQQATLDGIRSAFANLIQSGRPGDVLVFQFSGHGTQIRDLDGDDPDGKDEAICPADFHVNVPFSDDEIGSIINAVQPGVNLTLFMDCCHSGDISRLAVGRSSARSMEVRPRQIRLTTEERQRYRLYKRKRQLPRSVPGVRSKQEVLFAACREDQPAFERDGQGDFTRRATAILKSETTGITNTQFLERVIASFGEFPQQHPQLTCATSLRNAGLLAPLARGETPHDSFVQQSAADGGVVSVLAAGFDRIAQDLRKL